MPDQNIYEGEFRNDKFHGVGKMTYVREGFSFECIYRRGFASNIGRAVYKRDGSIYIGELNEDLKKHGCGVYIDGATGRRYEGEFEDDVSQGQGRIIFSSGSVYCGGVSKMMRQGAGKMEFKDPQRLGQVYEGQFEKDQREGVGYLYYPDGRVYCG